MTHILYLSYDGMTDQLGRSQVIPYLEGLSAMGYVIHLVSFEKSGIPTAEFQKIKLQLGVAGIFWTPLKYTKRPPVLSTVFDLSRMIREGKRLIRQHNIKLIHCRSYISGLAGLKLKRETGAAFLFDMRGFWADERVDGKLWDLSNPLYSRIYKYFKKKEKEMIASADGVVSLTHAAGKVIDSWGLRTGTQLPLTVIPCCADLNLFDPGKVSAKAQEQLKSELNINRQFPVISYLGAIGTWYMLDEMLQFFALVLKRQPAALFLFITKEPKGPILKAAEKAGVPAENIRVRPAGREEIPALLSLSNISVFFITPAFSKTASSPTKQAEIMGMGIPVICNSGIGDTDHVVNKYHSGIAVDLSDKNALEIAAQAIDEIENFSPDQIRRGAFEFYSLEEGVKKYADCYRKILGH